MDENPTQSDNTVPPEEESGPAFLDSVTGRITAVAMVALILAGIVAITFVLRGREDASAEQSPSERLRNRDFAVTGSEVLSINPPVISGTCPVETRFTAEIQTTGAQGTLVYRWFFDDAGATATQELELLAGETSVIVELTQAMGGSEGKFQGMTEQVAIQVLEQDGESIPVASRKSSFSIICAA